LSSAFAVTQDNLQLRKRVNFEHVIRAPSNSRHYSRRPAWCLTLETAQTPLHDEASDGHYRDEWPDFVVENVPEEVPDTGACAQDFADNVRVEQVHDCVSLCPHVQQS
jgi:hypothetical protein